MDVKKAVALAKQHVYELFANENIMNLGLEEVDFDEAKKVWHVTLGFSRPWDEPKNALAAIAGQTPTRRSYKVVRIADASEKVLSVKNRESIS